MQRKEMTALKDVRSFFEVKEKFPYGRTEGQWLVKEELNKSSRRMLSRSRVIFEKLGIPLENNLDNARVIFHDNGSAFAEVSISGMEFFIMGRDAIRSESIQSPFFNVVSGPCLFSDQAAQAYLETGRFVPLTNPADPVTEKVGGLKISPHLSTYEIEAVVRLSSLIKALVNTARIDAVHLNIPQVEYYLYLLNPYQKGYLSREQMLEWLDHVDKRHDRLFALMKKRSTRAKSVDVSDQAPLEPIKGYISEAIQDGYIPSLNEAKKLLRSNNSFWNNLMEVEEPASWQELNNLSYVFAELNAGVSCMGENMVGNVAVVVENPTESNIFAHAKEVADKLKARKNMEFSIVALYTHELLVPVGKESGKILYDFHEENIIQDVSCFHERTFIARQIFSAYNGKKRGEVIYDKGHK